MDYSVVIPALNAERFIDKALMSVKRQTVPAREVIVVDDGSRDSTSAIARSLDASVIVSSVSMGPSHARNTGVRASVSPLLAFLDADDEWLPDHVALLMDAMSAPATVFASAQAERFGMLDGPVPIALVAAEPLDLRDSLVVDNPVTQSGTMITRAVFDAAGGYDESMRLSEDYDLWTRVAECGKFMLVNRATVRRRIHEDQTSLRSTSSMVRSAWAVRRRAVARRLLGASDSERRHVNALLAKAARHDLEWAIWTGDADILAVVREQLTLTDDDLRLAERIDAVGGSGRPLRRVSQNLRRATYGAWSLLQRGGIAR